MSTNKEFSMHKGMSYKVTAKARGYYDYSTILNPDGTAITYDMTPYDGLKYNVDLTYNGLRTNTIDFSGTKLPYLGLANQTLQTTEYCLKSGNNISLPEYTKIYNNVDVKGDTTVENDVISNFSSSNYVSINKRNENMTVLLKIETGSDVNTTQQICILDSWFDFSIRSGNFACYNWGTGSDEALLSSITANTTYYWKIVLSSNGSRIYSYSTDGETYTEAANFTDTGVNWSNSQANEFNLGIIGGGRVSAFYGKIDLANSAILVEMTSGSTDLDTVTTYKLNDTSLIKVANAEYINNPEIDYTKNILNPNGQTSGNGYVKLSGFALTPGLAMNIAFKDIRGAIVNKSKTIFTIQGILQVYVQAHGSLDNDYIFSYKNNSGEWTNITAFMGLPKNNLCVFSMNFVSENTIKIEFTNSTTQKTLYSNTITDASITYFKSLDYAVGASWEGTNIGYSFYMVSYGQFVTYKSKKYKGVYEPHYKDDGTAKTLNCFANGHENVILSEKENYEDYTWLGTVEIPSHIVK